MKKPLLLVAEDDPDDQILLQNAVYKNCDSAIEIQFVWDGIELMDFLRKGIDHTREPLLIVLDLNMPRKDGRTVLKEIKDDPQLKRIPVAILTTSNLDTDILFCSQYSIIGYFPKPGSIHELQEILRKLCSDYLN